MNRNFLFIGLVILGLSCHTNQNEDATKRTQPFSTKIEETVRFPIKTKFEKFSYSSTDSSEWLSYLSGKYIHILDLRNKTIEDSINVSMDSISANKYGIIRSFCFSGKDSLFVLFDEAIFFWDRKKVQTIIPINSLDTTQYPTFRFQDLEDVPIYYDKTSHAIIGEVYCSDCWLTEPAFYRQKIIGSVSILSGRLKLFDISYPEKYVKNYYGFDMKPYGQSSDSITLISFPCDDKVSLLNRNSNTVDQFPARSIYQTVEAQPLIPLRDSGSVEQKMRHMAVQPYYSEIKFDRIRQLYYRFFRKAIPLKNKDGTYNDFFHKGLVLMVFNSQHIEIGEYELPKYYNSYLSFVGKLGLYVGDISPNPENKNVAVYHILTFK